MRSQIENALWRGLEWLRASQLPDGSWPDFVVPPAIESTEWTTGYISALLGRLPIYFEPQWSFMLTRAHSFLRSHARSAGGWGFASVTPVDADSTAWCLLSLLCSTEGQAEEFAAEREELLQHQNADSGGFCTYRPHNAEKFPPHSGYFAPLPCVTASVVSALYSLAYPEDRPRIREGIDFLLRTQRQDGSWTSFWWERGIYSTAAVVHTFSTLAFRCDASSRTRTWFQNLQDSTGAWTGDRVHEPDAFLTAMALRALVDLAVPLDDASIKAGLTWLLDMQRDDGSWDSLPILKMPDPDETWDPTAPKYEGLILPGQRRNFVTATVLDALSCFLGTMEKRPVRTIAEPVLKDAAVDEEVGSIIGAFEQHTSNLPGDLRRLARTTPAWINRGAGLSHYLPFWLDLNLADGQLRSAARQMALANRFGQFFCLLQDAVMDKNDTASMAALLPGDALFFQFVRGYQLLFQAADPFWSYFERYWYEYLNALAWEKRRCRRPYRYQEGDFRVLGRKLSPLKICCAGMVILANRVDALPDLEALVETLHIGCQILDDLRDWEEDLTHGHWSWALMLAREKIPDVPSIPQVEHLFWNEGLASTVVGTAVEYLRQAAERSGQLNLNTLHDWIEGYIRSAQRAIQAIPVRLPSTLSKESRSAPS